MKRLRFWWVGVAAALLLAVLIFVIVKRPGNTPVPLPPPDMEAVLHANNRGVGFMEQYKYSEAVLAFEEVVRLAPAWLPGRINLGIALLNTNVPANLERAKALFEQILQQEPDNPYGHFCLGIILTSQNKPEEALSHFETVTRLAPKDADAWYRLGSTLATTQPPGSPRVLECFRKATQLNPYLNSAIYGLAMNLRGQDPKKIEELLEEHRALGEAHWEDSGRILYGEMGHYADVIGHLPPSSMPAPSVPLPLFAPRESLAVKLRPGARWVTPADFQNNPTNQLRAAVRARFGAVMVVLDYNGDGKPDLFLVGAVVEAGGVADLLLRNDGDGRFSDVTAEAGLAGSRQAVGCCVADFDNDGLPDLFLTGVGHQFLFRNTGTGRFEDVTALAGLDQLSTICLGAAFVDLDQDGDLDLVVAQYAATPEEALGLLQGKAVPSGPGLAVFLNIGEAPPTVTGGKPQPLKPQFRRVDKPPALLNPGVAAVNLAAADLDGDHDIDLLVVADHAQPSMILNDRLLRFHRQEVPASLVPSHPWNGALILDANHDGRSDLFLVGPGHSPVLLLNQQKAEPPGPEFSQGLVDSTPLLQAQAIDLDLDGWIDVLGLSDQHRPVLLHNEGGLLHQAAEALGRDADWPADLLAVAAGDFSGQGRADLMTWSEASGLHLSHNLGNGQHGLRLVPVGHARSNTDGFGVWITAQVDGQWTGAEYTTLAAGLGQSHQPLVLGLGRHEEADVVRLRWPDHTLEAEFNQVAGPVIPLEELNRVGVSCPVLFAWNGKRFDFITDFLGAGSVGEEEPGGGHRPPRPEESVKIEAEQLVPREGRYFLKVNEPMDEVTYLDRLQLQVVDHPSDLRVYPDERFVSDGPPPSQDLLVLRQPVFPVRARDHRGQDVTAALQARDRATVRDFARRSWLGFAEDHWVELDFGDRLASFGAKAPLVLCLAGWTDYPYPESIWAADQAGMTVQYPVLERQGPDGHWLPIGEVGFPAGLPRMMTVDVTGKLNGPTCVLRLRTNMDVFWDQIFVAPLSERISATALQDGKKTTGAIRVTCLEVSAADMQSPGCAQEYTPDGLPPVAYDAGRIEPVPMARQSGNLTRLGEVAELLHTVDDRFVIFGPGDEITVQFDAQRLPELPPGWVRDFVLRTWGYCKDPGPYSAKGDTIGPLPFKAMSNFPYGPEEHYPRDPIHDAYLRQFNTRKVGQDKKDRNAVLTAR